MGRLSLVYSIVAIAAFGAFSPAHASNHIAISDQDCSAVLEAHATAPKTVPADLVQQCRDYLALAPAAGANAQSAGAPVDPCSGAGAGSSVYCWGNWSVLSPAAGPSAPDVSAAVIEQYPRPELASAFDPDLTPAGSPPVPLPLGNCSAGATCGFATQIPGTLGAGAAADTQTVDFDMATNGQNFTVSFAQPGEINSVQNMTPVYLPIPPGDVEEMRSAGRDGDQLSALFALAVRDTNGEITLADGRWINADSNGAVSGQFAWGTATSQTDLQSLSAANAVVTFAGVMAGPSGTNAEITLNYGAAPTWTGSWTNTAYSFDGGGTIVGANFVSSPAEFSSNVQSGFVQGAILGEAGNQSVAHAIDVVLDGVGEVREVGVLRQN